MFGNYDGPTDGGNPDDRSWELWEQQLNESSGYDGDSSVESGLGFHPDQTPDELGDPIGADRMPEADATSGEAARGEAAAVQTPAEIKAACDMTVEMMLNEAYLELAEGNPLGTDLYPSGAKVAQVAADLIETASAARDTAKADYHLGALLKMSWVEDLEIVRASFAGTGANSELATAMLLEYLDKERVETEQAVTAMRARSDSTIIVWPQYSLDAVVQACVEADMSPQTWIDNYAADHNHHWLASTAYLAYVAERSEGASGQETARSAFDAKLAELATPGAYEDKFVFSEIRTALQQVGSVDVQNKLLDRYAAIFSQKENDIPVTHNTVDEIINLGRQVIANEPLATTERVTYFEALVDAATQEYMRSSDVSDDFIARQRIPFDAAVMRYRGASPADIIAMVDTRYGITLKAGDAADETGAHDSPFPVHSSDLLFERDEELSSLVSEAMRYGVATDAKAYIESIGDENVRHVSLTSALAHASNPEAVAELQPGELELQINPHLAEQVAWAATRTSNNAEVIATEITARATQTDDGNSYERKQFVESAYKLLMHDHPEQALSLARTLLMTLREQGGDPDLMNMLSYDLIKAGDADEPHLAYEDLLGRPLQPYIRLRRLNALSNHIAAARRSA